MTRRWGRSGTGTAWLLPLLLVVALAAAGCGSAGGTAADRPEVVLGHIPQWTSTTLVNWPARLILEEMGYAVRFQEAEIGIVYQGTALGDIDVFLDAWYPAQKEHWDAWGSRLERLGVIYDGAALGWIVPDYVRQVRSIADLKAHAALFDSDGNGRGEVLSYGAGSGGSITSQRVIEAYGLPFEVVDSSTAALLAAMQDALNKKRPFVGMGWRPHWMFNRWPIRFLEDPKGIWQPSTVYAVARKGFAQEHPELARFLAAYRIPLEEFEAMTYEYNVNKRDPAEIAREWITAHRDRVDAMIAAARGGR